METYDVLVLGGGSGSQVATAAADDGLEAAVLEPGPLGGACITRGCIPSKALIHRAELLEEIRRADRFGIDAEVTDVTYGEITDAIRETVFGKADRQRQSLEANEHVTLYESAGRFVDDRTVELVDPEREESGADAEGRRIRGENVIIAVGSRPTEPPIDGLEDLEYLTSDNALYLDDQPERLVIVGGGYIAAELGYFFAALGTEVTIVGRSDRLVPREDEAIGEVVTESLERYCELYTGFEATAVSSRNGGVSVSVESTDGGDGEGPTKELEADELLVAAGRRPNTDTLDLEETGLETAEDGSIPVNKGLETDVDGIWALGDVTGEFPFKHVADYESEIVAANVLGDEARAVDYTGVPHAVFTSPQVASLGKTESELEDENREYDSAATPYGTAPMGVVLKADDGLVKVLAGSDGEILGCHIVGPQASTLIHEVAVVVQRGEGTVSEIAETVHVHPALNEVVVSAFDEVASKPYSTTPDWRDVSEM
ncbi:dihydrolipoyl dehydrogenase [Halostagnicola sp. A-GB9-2]|uniref:dihydrolipoyl dehydrogenase n=1 Tax=Halostagnicola sp. A-GB9-2 TaxID=3048066 RepID=UPI0024C0999B|nr:dihydrolipoyl dehydrogenase [Halostagnicola sp. A-GB9-2]MDJ1432979.1 dihydrolipoyl dehydrogenase [Halostagnicola sp. A-GB9-2]